MNSYIHKMKKDRKCFQWILSCRLRLKLTFIQVEMNERNIEVVLIKAARVRINNKSNERWMFTDYVFQSSIIRWMFEVFTHQIYVIIMSFIICTYWNIHFHSFVIIVVIILNPVFRIFFHNRFILSDLCECEMQKCV